MIIAQGWKDNKVHVLALTLAMNGMAGWQVYYGVYDPNKGETYDKAKWECRGSCQNLVDLMYYHVFSDMATWAEGGTEVKNIKDVLLSIHDQLKQISAYVDQARQQNQIALHEPWIYQQSLQQKA